MLVKPRWVEIALKTNATQEKAIESSNVRKRFGKLQALNGLDFTLGAEERVALLGPNGAGKTTFLRALSGLLRPDEGEISLFGESPTTPLARRWVGFIPQELALYADLTIRENLECFGRFYGLRGRVLRDRIDWALHWITLTDRAHNLVRQLSGGMKRRVNIACSCLHQPKLLILDEPTVGVDPQSRARIYAMLDEIHQNGMAILWTTHLMSEAESNSDRIVVMDHGRKIADGRLEDLAHSALGYAKRVELRVSGEVTTVPERLVWDSQNRCWVGAIQDVSLDLPSLMRQFESAGVSIIDVQVRTPNLQDVFLQLTGSELRE